MQQPIHHHKSDIATLRPGIQTSLINGCWPYDRYKEQQPLDAGARVLVADLTGPGIIKQLHISKTRPLEKFSRGLVLEIWFEDAEQPAVQCPVSDFFADGCNGACAPFSSEFVESYPGQYNAFFPMPFRQRARVYLRNDTQENAMTYVFVEWEHGVEVGDDQGYFHATYSRQSFRLSNATNLLTFSHRGTGHLVGRQFSMQSDEPLFREMLAVMEGNNEVNLDGRERALDYLGTECSFNFGWGWQSSFTTPRGGAPFVKHEPPAQISTYRFHHHMPIRFAESIEWRINYEFEEFPFKKDFWKPKLERAFANGGCWADFAMVHYWYDSRPGSFNHAPLESVGERSRFILGKPEEDSLWMSRIKIPPFGGIHP